MMSFAAIVVTLVSPGLRVDVVRQRVDVVRQRAP